MRHLLRLLRRNYYIIMTRQEILNYIKTADVGEVNLMEVCGTHTHAIARAGIKGMLPPNIHLLSGPGCPVCVTPQEVIDEYLDLAMREDVIITTYGDMIRVPGSEPGDNLALRKAKGADVRIVYSPIDAVEIAKQEMAKADASKLERVTPKQVVFLGVGFETTAPGTAMAIKVAREEGVTNFSIFSMLKRVEPALRALMKDEDFNVQGFLVPGHVAVILGEDGFRYLTDEYNIPSVIAGFEPDDILLAIYKLIKQIEDDASAHIENAYTRLVHPEGNKLAMDVIDSQLVVRDDIFRGMGLIEGGGYGLGDELADYDAEKIFDIHYKPSEKKSACRCGEVIKGQLDPKLCPLFGNRCLPEDPVGPCMVSGEGACSAAYKYL